MEQNDIALSEEELARRYWVLYCARQCTIITALFCGQFKSFSQCAGCSRQSSKYDTFSMLQLPVPKTEMRALSLVISYSNGRVPILCSIRVSVESTLADIHQALNELDPSFGLLGKRLSLGVMTNSNVIQEFDDSFRLSTYESRDPNDTLIVFVYPALEKCMGCSLCHQYNQSHFSRKLLLNQPVRLRLKDDENHQLTGVIRGLLTDFCFDVACSDEKTRRVFVTDLVDGEKYMLEPGDFVICRMLPPSGSLPQRSDVPKYQYGVYLGCGDSPGSYAVRLFPSETEVFVKLDQLHRRHVKPRKIYVIQRYSGIVSVVFLAHV